MKKRIMMITLVVIAFLMLAAPAFAQPEKESSDEKKAVTLTATVAAPGDRWEFLFDKVEKEMNANHPDLDISIEAEVLPYDQTHNKLVTMMVSQTPVDLVSLDVIWLGEFAEGGFLKDLTSDIDDWGRMSDYYESNQAGSKIDGKYYSIWSWTDVRVLWYWPDLLEAAGVEPEELSTWEGYIAGAQKLNSSLEGSGIEGVHLVGAPHSPDMWYPYLWMLGGELLEKRGDTYYPAFQNEEGVRALEFLRQQVKNGIEPQPQHFWGQEFADKKFAVMLEGSWLAGKFPGKTAREIESMVGVLPLFPTPEEGMASASMAGGWALSVPKTSEHPDLAFEMLTTIQKPEIMAEFCAEFGYLPTQRILMEDERYSSILNESIPFLDKFKEILPTSYGRPAIPEYPKIADAIRIAIEEVYYNDRDPKMALTDAAEKVAVLFGWDSL